MIRMNITEKKKNDIGMECRSGRKSDKLQGRSCSHSQKRTGLGGHKGHKDLLARRRGRGSFHDKKKEDRLGRTRKKKNLQKIAHDEFNTQGINVLRKKRRHGPSGTSRTMDAASWAPKKEKGGRTHDKKERS